MDGLVLQQLDMVVQCSCTAAACISTSGGSSSHCTSGNWTNVFMVQSRKWVLCTLSTCKHWSTLFTAGTAASKWTVSGFLLLLLLVSPFSPQVAIMNGVLCGGCDHKGWKGPMDYSMVNTDHKGNRMVPRSTFWWKSVPHSSTVILGFPWGLLASLVVL